MAKHAVCFNVDKDIALNPAAFKHGISEASIRYVLNYPEYEGPLEEFDNKYIIIGFYNSGRLLEILYNRTDGAPTSVFRAMKCRNIFLHLLGIYEKLMSQMTDEEADCWDDCFAKNPPKVDPGKSSRKEIFAAATAI
jgi:hypothetical protein